MLGLFSASIDDGKWNFHKCPLKKIVPRNEWRKTVEVRALMSGVFYRKPTPEAPPYVEVGDQVKKGQVLGLLETMKVFQKIKAPADGKVVEILAENEGLIKDNQVIFVIEAA